MNPVAADEERLKDLVLHASGLLTTLRDAEQSGLNAADKRNLTPQCSQLVDCLIRYMSILVANDVSHNEQAFRLMQANCDLDVNVHNICHQGGRNKGLPKKDIESIEKLIHLLKECIVAHEEAFFNLPNIPIALRDAYSRFTTTRLMFLMMFVLLGLAGYFGGIVYTNMGIVEANQLRESGVPLSTLPSQGIVYDSRRDELVMTTNLQGVPLLRCIPDLLRIYSSGQQTHYYDLVCAADGRNIYTTTAALQEAAHWLTLPCASMGAFRNIVHWFVTHTPVTMEASLASAAIDFRTVSGFLSSLFTVTAGLVLADGGRRWVATQMTRVRGFRALLQ